MDQPAGVLNIYLSLAICITIVLNRIITTLVYIFCTAWYACAPEPICPDESPEIKITFLTEVYEETDSAAIINDTTVVLVEVSALGTDSIFFEQDTTFSIVLPLNAASSQVDYFFKTMDLYDQPLEVTDTLQINYIREQQLVSEECGPVQLYNSLEIMGDTFDSLALISNEIDPAVNVNIEVYR